MFPCYQGFLWEETGSTVTASATSIATYVNISRISSNCYLIGRFIEVSYALLVSL
jgi:hypothetical protein